MTNVLKTILKKMLSICVKFLMKAYFYYFQIVSTFPKIWFSSLSNKETIPHLSMFARCLVSIAEKLYESSKDSTKKDVRYVGYQLIFIWAIRNYANIDSVIN